jgi:primosomal protein N'
MTTPNANRYTCPQCGGEMLYDAQSAGLKCQYCNFQQPLSAAQPQGQTAAPREIALADGMARAARGLGAHAPPRRGW